MARCEELGIGLQTGPATHEIVPIVPAAIIYDLGRGGQFANRPTAEFGYRAARAASRSRVQSGTVGAGTGAVSAGLKGGVGNAVHQFEDGSRIAALAVVNAAGTLVDPESGLPWVGGHGLRRPDREDRRRLRELLAPRLSPLNTTIGVVVTDVALTQAECTKVAQVAHDGLARAARPSHLLVDGDTIFALSVGTDGTLDPASRTTVVNRLLAHGAEVFAQACLDALLAAEGVQGFPSYREVCPSAFVRP
jgi:L-aminopeptidase/D-esterase-like protein